MKSFNKSVKPISVATNRVADETETDAKVNEDLSNLFDNVYAPASLAENAKTLKLLYLIDNSDIYRVIKKKHSFDYCEYLTYSDACFAIRRLLMATVSFSTCHARSQRSFRSLDTWMATAFTWHPDICKLKYATFWRFCTDLVGCNKKIAFFPLN